MRGLLPEDIGRLVSIGDPRLAPGATRVAYCEQRVDLEQNQYHSRVWVAVTDGATPPVQLSPDEVTASLARWSPDGAHIAYVARLLDDEDALSEIRVVPSGGGDHRVVARWREAPHELEWSPNGMHLAFVARDPDVDRYGPAGEKRKEKDIPPRRIERLFTRLDSVGWIADRPSRVFVVRADGADGGEDATPTTITPGPFEASGIAWSPGGDRIAFSSARHDTWDLDWETDLYVAALDGDAIERLTAPGHEHSLPSWSPAGDMIACYRAGSPMQGPWHGRVATVDVDGSHAVHVLTEKLDRNAAPYPTPRGAVWVDDGLLFLVDDRGFEHLWRVATGEGEPEPVVAGERTISGYDARDGAIAFVAGGPASLPELFVQRDGDETKLTDVTAELRAAGRELAAPQRFVAHTSDGDEIDCWIIEPEHEAGARVPALLNIHGGPFTSYGERFFDEFQFEVAAGFAVVFCNPRGSSGGTEAWGRAIRWPECEIDPGSGWGGVDYDDVMACVDEAVRRYDFVDPDRIGVMGGSYGGYMTSWIVGHTDRFAAAISERSCNNLVSLDYASDVAGSFVSYVGVQFVDDPEPFMRQSPITYVREMRTPLLILHSENDLRCPIGQAEELFVSLRLLGRTPEFVRFPGESHELSRSGAPRHRMQRAELILDFMRRHLQPA